MSVPKSTIIAGVAMAASLVALGIGIATARSHIVALEKTRSLARTAAPEPSSPTADPPASADSNSIQLIKFASNPQLVPPFLVNDLSGNMISTAEWRGKVVLLNFWATWCPPCREEIPALIALQAEYKNRLQIIGVSMDDAVDENKVDAFAKQAGINYPIVMASPELVAEYGGVPALPTSFVVNPEGRVVQKHIGLHEPAEYEAEVRALLALPVNAKVELFQDTGQIFLKNATLATVLPGVDMKGLTKEQKLIALKRMNTETCTCGCGLTVAQCRINDTTCDISKHLAGEIVKQVAGGQATAPPTPPPPPPPPSSSD